MNPSLLKGKNLAEGGYRRKHRPIDLDACVNMREMGLVTKDQIVETTTRLGLVNFIAKLVLVPMLTLVNYGTRKTLVLSGKVLAPVVKVILAVTVTP